MVLDVGLVACTWMVDPTCKSYQHFKVVASCPLSAFSTELSNFKLGFFHNL